MKLTILGNCVTTPQDVAHGLESFDYTIHVPTDYVEVANPRGTTLGWVRNPRLQPGKWRFTLEIVSPASWTIDYGADPDNLRAILGFDLQYEVSFEETFVFPPVTSEIVTGPDSDPHAIRFTPAGQYVWEETEISGGSGGLCFPTEEDLPISNIIIQGWNTGIVIDGVLHIQPGQPSEIVLRITGELVEAAP